VTMSSDYDYDDDGFQIARERRTWLGQQGQWERLFTMAERRGVRVWASDENGCLVPITREDVGL
jgi:hypothetical protein